MWIKVNEVGAEHLIPRIINTDYIKMVSSNGEYIKFINGDDMVIDENSANKLVELLVERNRYDVRRSNRAL